jgi:EmrB/QacA subfamily drug resistance transporter
MTGASLLRERPRPEWIRRRPKVHWLVVATVCVGAFMGQLDASIVALAFPTLRAEFHTTLATVEWVGLAYLLALVAAVPAVGRLADMIGRKLLYTYGFGVFTLASAGCALAPSLPVLVVCRTVQGIGAAMLQANSVALITTAMPAGRLGRGIGAQGTAQALGLALGPAVGGLLIALGGWRLLFLVNVPAGLLGTIAGWLLLPRSRDLAPRTRFDWTGLGLFVPAVSALLLALSLGTGGELAMPASVALGAAAVGAGVLFVRHERHTAEPMLDLGLFARRSFGAGVSAGLLGYLVLFGVLFVTPFFLEGVRHQPTAMAGLTLAVLPAALGVTAPVAGALTDRLGPRTPTVLGMLITAAGLLALGGTAATQGSTGMLTVALATVGVGVGMFTPANNTAIMTGVATRQAGVAGGILNLTRGLGTSLGVALTALIFDLAAGGTTPASLPPALAQRGFIAAVTLLAAAATAAAALAALRGGPPSTPAHATNQAGHAPPPGQQITRTGGPTDMSRQPDPSPWPLADVVATLAEEFRGIHSTSTIQRLVQECGHQFANARVVDFIPLLVHRLARERLHALTTSTDRP